MSQSDSCVRAASPLGSVSACSIGGRYFLAGGCPTGIPWLLRRPPPRRGTCGPWFSLLLARFQGVRSEALSAPRPPSPVPSPVLAIPPTAHFITTTRPVMASLAGSGAAKRPSRADRKSNLAGPSPLAQPHLRATLAPGRFARSRGRPADRTRQPLHHNGRRSASRRFRSQWGLAGCLVPSI